MKVRVLGCYGSELDSRRTTAFLLNGSVLLDAGTISAALSLREQARIRHILVSHSHLDHIKGIPILADNVYGRKRESITLLSTAGILRHLKAHLFNNVIWPDFTVIPGPDRSVFRLRALAPGRATRVGDLSVKPIRVNHSVETVGFLIRDRAGSLLYTSDTGPCDRLWEEANRTPDLRAVFIEASFPNRLARLAGVSGHLTPALLQRELSKLRSPEVDVYVTHMKPRYMPEIVPELKSLRDQRLSLLRQGQVLVF